MIRRAAFKNLQASSSQIRAQLSSHVDVSTRTIHRRLVKYFGRRAHCAAITPFLSKKNVSGRLTFCKEHKYWTAEMWRRVMFSDETNIKQFAPHKITVRRPKNTRFLHQT